jgi:hypothetical protein
MLLCTLLNSGHDELTVPKCLGCCGQAAICGMGHHIGKLVASLIHVDFATYYARDINVEMLFCAGRHDSSSITSHLAEDILMSMTDVQKEIFIQLVRSLVLFFLRHNVEVVQFGGPLKK